MISKLAGIILLLVISFQGCAESSNIEDTAFLWLEYGKKINETNGSVTQTVYLKSSSDSLTIADIKNLTAFYCDGRQKGEKQYYIIPIEQKDGLYFLSVNTSTQFLYHVYVTGTCAQEHFTAQIAFPLYGDGLDKNIKKEPVLLESSKTFTSIDLVSAGNFPWAQTGQTFQFLYKPIHPSSYPVQEMKLIDIGKKSYEKLMPGDDGRFSFTPPHDQRLDDGGYHEYKEIILYTEEFVGNEVYKTSMNLLLRRSLSAHNNLTLGLCFFFAVMAVISGVVLFRRRSF
ncbi:hypothetical protein SOV_25360 [Sporomusa ovata DSM 2662]|uniref:Uncharacterized protein n=1 Tax=Sporomusa ovata TaxID=2378 RepID=A0A0U1L5H3_9FIRM|nr:hypothetical protein [Sporomusa ovata]EQB25849.1 hypothetical protein SOV_4c05160 [Sporomusa ovata DSM 2662]CQR74413.1 hypothetical protein SpAn4DRAFT_0875 [Sporomusa ovata]